MARKARHKKVFAQAGALRFASLLKLPTFNKKASSAVRKVFLPHASNHHGTVASPAHSLFKRYSSAVGVLFLLSTLTPPTAYSESSFASEDFGAYWDTTAFDSPLMTDDEGYLTKFNPQTSTGDRTTVNDALVHTIASGETISTIAAQYKIKTNTILWANGLSASSTLKVNQKLVVPPTDGVYHEVTKGENVDKIAKAYSVNKDAILKQNSLLADATVAVGDEIFVPGAKPLVTVKPTVAKVTTSGRETPARIASTSRVATGGAVLQPTNATPTTGKIFIFPTRGSVTQGFHPGHYAYDIANPDRPPIWAAGDGTIVKVVSGCADVSYRCGGGYGNHIIVDHGNGLQTLYGHLTYSSVQVGDRVTQGQVLGKMGRSGNVYGRTGIHVHFEVRKNNVKMSPGNYF